MKQHHYIISYETDTKSWVLDADCEEVRFPDGTIWNDETQEWESGYLGDGKYESNEEQLGVAINAALAVLNSITNGEEA
jgi:hypothetical protein